MKPWTLVLLTAIECMGCTTMALERHTLAQAESAADLRFQEVLGNLARVANDPAALPAYSSIFAGTIQITDTGTLASTTVWQHVKGVAAQNGFGSESGNPQLNRQILQNWTLDPIAVPEKLEAMRSACRWVIYGLPLTETIGYGLLASPDQAPFPGRHFGVLDRLERLPSGWLHVGTGKDIPAGACYKAHCDHTWVWVMPDGMRSLADFTLVLQDIARVDSNSPTLFWIPPPASAFRFRTIDYCPDDCYVTAVAVAGPCRQLVPDQPYVPYRVDNVGAAADFRSQINAAGATH